MADGINLDYYLAQLYKIQEHREQKAEKDIRKIFKQLMQELTAFVGTEYQKYAEDDKLSYEILNKHAEYAKFVSEVNKRLNTSTQKAFKIAKALCDETYAKCFEGFSNAVQRAVEGNKNLSEILHTTTRSASQRAIKRAVENPVSGLTLTDNLEKNRKEIVYKINQEIGVGLANGSSYTNMAKRISEAVDGNYKKSMLITRTETHRVKEAGYNDAAKEVDDVLRDDESDFRMVKVWRTAQDDAVRKTNKANHKDMQGVVVLQDEEFNLGHGVKTLVPGSSGSAANDCNCRCRVSRKIMSDAEFFKATGRHFPKTEQEASGKQEPKQNEFKVAEGKDILTTFKRREEQYDFEIEDVMNAQGFDGLPKVVSADEFEEAVKKSKFVAQRGYYAPSKEILDEYRNQLYNGKWYVDCSNGGTAYGQGMYGAYNLGDKADEKTQFVANLYARGGYVETFTLAENAKTITLSELNKKREELMVQASEFLEKNGWTKENIEIADKMASNANAGIIAAKLGYDALLVERENFVVVLNRTAVIFKEATGNG